MRCKQLSVSPGKIVATTLVVASLVLPFKAKAEELNQAKEGVELTRQTIVQTFYQYRKGEGHEAGLGVDTTLGIGPTNLDLGLGIAVNLETGITTLETAGTKLTFPLFLMMSATGYMQRSRFLGGQTAAGGVLHAKLDQVVLHAGAEYDLITRAVPVFVGADVDLGPVIISSTVIAPIVPEQNSPNLGGTLRITWKTKIANFFTRAFGMMDPATKTPLAGNVQAGVEISL